MEKQIINMSLFNQSPLDQFGIRDIWGIEGDLLANVKLSLTNIGLYLIITTFIIFMFYLLGTNYNKSSPNNW